MATTRDLFEKYLNEQKVLEAEARRLESELQGARRQLDLISAMLDDLSDLSGTPRPARSSYQAHGSSVDDLLPGRSGGRGVSSRGMRGGRRAVARGRGRRTTGAPGENVDINELSIVDATLALARQNNVTEADAGEVQQWFEDAEFKRRNGTPSRNSIYVSLNREATQSADRDDWRVRKVSRGRFEFRFDV